MKIVKQKNKTKQNKKELFYVMYKIYNWGGHEDVGINNKYSQNADLEG